MYKVILKVLLVLTVMSNAYADQVGDSTLEGNKLYEQGNFNEAIDKYDQALVQAPQVLEPKFNKANSYYRLDDLGNAIDLYKQVATESKDMKLVARAKYNLGNSYFQQGSKLKDSDLNKALDDLKTAIGSWRGVLDIEPENEKAAKNIEVARLTIKDIIDQLNKQKQDPNQPQNQNQQQDPNQPQQSNQQQSQQQQDQQQGQKQDSEQKKDQEEQQKSGTDPNQPQDPNEQEKQQQQQQEKSDQEKQQQMAVPDTTAQKILDREQRQRKERQIVQRGGWQKVDKDW
jgi:Ca-activated chloride channel family protein